ncbi:MAG TPA: VOC family protein, partial [Bacillales bacterium]|nr:VOC family protein [Bacillales bacterium]
GHVALYAKDPARMTDFYSDLFELTISARDKSDRITFMGIDPRSNHHDLSFCSNPGASHIAFYVDTLEEFRGFHQELRRRKIPIFNCQMVILGLRMDFPDPEGNIAEVVWLHGKCGKFPFFEKVDLDKMTDEEIYEIVDSMPLDERFN